MHGPDLVVAALFLVCGSVLGAQCVKNRIRIRTALAVLRGHIAADGQVLKCSRGHLNADEVVLKRSRLCALEEAVDELKFARGYVAHVEVANTSYATAVNELMTNLRKE